MSLAAFAQENSPNYVLINNVNVWDGNSLEDLSVIRTSDKWFDAPTPPESPETIRIIMKDGEIYKNALKLSAYRSGRKLTPPKIDQHSRTQTGDVLTLSKAYLLTDGNLRDRRSQAVL